MPPKPKRLAFRFWPKVVVTDGCWLWTGYRNPAGYGMFYMPGRPRMAHRVAYEMVVGVIPDGLQLDHLCRNRACVNPAHLEPVTNAENQARGVRASRTRCPAGHPYDEANTWRRDDGSRRCRACHRTAERVRYQRKVQA